MTEFEAECLQGVHFGMDGKTLIHPKQIAATNRLFAPSESEVSACRRMIEAHAGTDCGVHKHTGSLPPLSLSFMSSYSSARLGTFLLRMYTHNHCMGRKEAVSRGDGVFVMDGRLVENLHVANAQRIVQLADAIQARVSNSTEA